MNRRIASTTHVSVCIYYICKYCKRNYTIMLLAMQWLAMQWLAMQWLAMQWLAMQCLHIQKFYCCVMRVFGVMGLAHCAFIGSGESIFTV